MQQIRTRQDLFDFVASRAPTKACKTAIAQGRATLLGRYQLAGDVPFWAVQVKSRRSKVWAFTVSPTATGYTIVPSVFSFLRAIPKLESDGVL